MRDRVDVYTDMAREEAEAVRRLEPDLKARRNLRDLSILAAHKEGATINRLAEATGLSWAQVQRICDLSKQGKVE